MHPCHASTWDHHTCQLRGRGSDWPKSNAVNLQRINLNVSLSHTLPAYHCATHSSSVSTRGGDKSGKSSENPADDASNGLVIGITSVPETDLSAESCYLKL